MTISTQIKAITEGWNESGNQLRGYKIVWENLLHKIKRETRTNNLQDLQNGGVARSIIALLTSYQRS